MQVHARRSVSFPPCDENPLTPIMIGGKITVRTKLIWPSPSGKPDPDSLSNPDINTPGLANTPPSYPPAPPTLSSAATAMDRKSGDSVRHSSQPQPQPQPVAGSQPLSVQQLHMHNVASSGEKRTKALDRIVVRIEIQDTGECQL